eukprot:11399_4
MRCWRSYLRCNLNMIRASLRLVGTAAIGPCDDMMTATFVFVNCFTTQVAKMIGTIAAVIEGIFIVAQIAARHFAS